MSLAMSKDEREQFLAGLHVGIVSIPREGRAPLTVPIWYDYTPDGEVWMITGLNSLKGKALGRTDRISFCVQTEDLPYRYVSVEGPFTTRALAEGENLHMAVRYLGDEQGQAYAAGMNDEDNMVVSLSPETWLSVDYSKMGT